MPLSPKKPGARPSTNGDTKSRPAPASNGQQHRKAGTTRDEDQIVRKAKDVSTKNEPTVADATAATSNGQQHQEPAADLHALAERVRAEHEAGLAATRKAVGHYIAAGLLLIEVRRECERLGVKFTKWLKLGKAGVSKARAYHYIALAELCLVTRQLTSEELEEHWRRISNGAAEDTGGAHGHADTGGCNCEVAGSGTKRQNRGRRKENQPAADPDAPKLYPVVVEKGGVKEFEEMMDCLAERFGFQNPRRVGDESLPKFTEIVLAVLRDSYRRKNRLLAKEVASA